MRNRKRSKRRKWKKSCRMMKKMNRSRGRGI